MNFQKKKGNLASILEIDENLEKNFNVFKDSPENAKKEYNVTNVVLPQISNIEKQYFMWKTAKTHLLFKFPNFFASASLILK